MEAWQQFLLKLKEELGAKVVDTWMPQVIRFDAANIYLLAKDSFQINWFEEHVRPKLKGFVNNNQRAVKVHLELQRKEERAKEAIKSISFEPDPIDAEMSMAHFVPEENNLVVFKLLQELPPFNPIYIYGPKGCGKTHLLMATGLALKKMGKKVFYVLAETFTEHVVQAIRLGQMQAFRKIYRDIDVLIVDNIHILSKKTATQEEFFHTFNTLHTIGKLIVLSAKVAPGQLSEIEPRLVSRFEWGISLGMGKTNAKAILEKKAEIWKYPLNPEIATMLEEKCPSDPVLALQALILRAKNNPLNVQMAERLLKDLIEKESAQGLTFEKIVKEVASRYGIKSEDLLGKSQMREYALPRQIAMYLCRKKLKAPYQKIGELFDRDHSTVMSSVKQIEKAIEENRLKVEMSL